MEGSREAEAGRSGRDIGITQCGPFHAVGSLCLVWSEAQRNLPLFLENTNGLIRQRLPRARALASLTQRQCDAIVDKTQDRGRAWAMALHNNDCLAINLVALAG